MIADAALRLMGREGARGLTHRGVDAEAGLPAGSTSYYCRRRVDLLELALRRHAQIDRASLAALATLFEGRERPGELARALGRFIRAQERVQLVARFELFLACSREPVLRQVLTEQRTGFASVLEHGLTRWGVARPRSAANALIAFIEGVLLERARLERDVLPPGELRRVLKRLIAAPG